MGGKQTQTTAMLFQMIHCGAGNFHAVKATCTTSQFVYGQWRSPVCSTDFRSNSGHFDEERGLAQEDPIKGIETDIDLVGGSDRICFGEDMASRW